MDSCGDTLMGFFMRAVRSVKATWRQTPLHRTCSGPHLRTTTCAGPGLRSRMPYTEPSVASSCHRSSGAFVTLDVSNSTVVFPSGDV